MFMEGFCVYLYLTFLNVACCFNVSDVILVLNGMILLCIIEVFILFVDRVIVSLL